MVSVLAGNREHLSAADFLVNLLFLGNVAPWLLGGPMLGSPQLAWGLESKKLIAPSRVELDR